MLPATISRYTYLLSILSSILDALACRLLGPPLPLLCGDFVGNVLYDGSPNYFSYCAEQLTFEPQNDDLEQLMALTSICLSSSAESATKTRPGVRGAVGARSRDNS